MFFLLPILLFAALAVNSLAVPQMAWPLRARTESSPLRPKKEEFQLRRTETSQRNFSLPLHTRTDAGSLHRRSDRTPSPLSPRNFAFPLQARDDSDVLNSSTTSTDKVRPRDVFAIRPRIRPRKSDSALIQRLAARQSNDSSEGSLLEPGSPISGLGATIPSDPGLNATILAPNGTDITSSFKIMFYHSPSIVALASLNGRKRQFGGRDEPQTQCRSPTAVFAYSYCTPKGGIAGTTRTFQIFCRERSQGKNVSPLKPKKKENSAANRVSTKYVYEGHNRYRNKVEAEPPDICGEDEICLDSPVEWARNENQETREKYTVARCVSARNFKQLPSVNDLATMLGKARVSVDAAGSSMDDLAGYLPDDQAESSSSNQAGSSSNHDLSGNSLALRLTGPGDQPLPASIEVDAGEVRSRSTSGTIATHPCPNPCMEVSMSDFPENTNWISAHARLVSSLAVAGVMWVALFH